MNRLLGKLRPIHDSRTLQIERYLPAALPPPPPSCTRTTNIKKWGVCGNDQYGDCVFATAAHEILLWNAIELGNTTPIADSAVIAMARHLHGLDGYAILDRLNYWRKNGMWAHQIHAFADIACGAIEKHRQAIHIFGCSDIGLQLPEAWKKPGVWDVGHGRQYERGSWGGHSVPLTDYDEDVFYCITWGQPQAITPAAVTCYCDEAYAVISKDWYAKNQNSPTEIDINSLDADLAEITA